MCKILFSLNVIILILIARSTIRFLTIDVARILSLHNSSPIIKMSAVLHTVVDTYSGFRISCQISGIDTVRIVMNIVNCVSIMNDS